MSEHNTGTIAQRHVCEYTGEEQIIRKPTMYDAARKMERDAVARKKASAEKAEEGA